MKEHKDGGIDAAVQCLQVGHRRMNTLVNGDVTVFSTGI